MSVTPAPGGIGLPELAVAIARVETQVERLVADVSALADKVQDHDRWRWHLAGSVGALGAVAGAALTYFTTH